MIRYYCSGFDINDAFGHGLGKMIKSELADTKSIVYIPAGQESIEKAQNKYISIFTDHFKNAGIQFDKINLIEPNQSSEKVKSLIKNASFVMLMGGDPFKQKELCEKLGLLEELKKYAGVMLGFSAGAMLMSKNIIITPDQATNIHAFNQNIIDLISSDFNNLAKFKTDTNKIFYKTGQIEFIYFNPNNNLFNIKPLLNSIINILPIDQIKTEIYSNHLAQSILNTKIDFINKDQSEKIIKDNINSSQQIKILVII